MITPEQAHEQARKTYGEQGEVGVYEFDAGYVAWRVPPPREDPTRPPETVGGGCIVIDKSSGEVTDWPMLAPEVIAENYQRKLDGKQPNWHDQ